MTWIQTYSGVAFDLVKPVPAMVVVRDVAHALANIGRYTGHAEVFYSVAQHCVLMSRLVDPRYALAALVHDAPEAYVGDMAAPLKRMCPDFACVEQRVTVAVLEALIGRSALRPEEEAAIRHADLRMLATERRDLLGPHPRPWVIDEMEIRPYHDTIWPWHPAQAEHYWLKRLQELRG